MILHTFVYDKFHINFIKKIRSLYNDEHVFMIYNPNGEKTEYEKTLKGVYYSSDDNSGWFSLLKSYIVRADRVVIHSLFGLKICRVLNKMSNKYGYKFVWIMWGADLYNAYWNRKNGIINIYREYIRRGIIKKLGAVGGIPSDYDFLKSHYVTNASYYEVTYNYSLPNVPSKCRKNDEVVILLGNSASKSCRYEKCIDMLSTYRDKSIKVYCLLSYPKDERYIRSIIEIGKNKLGDKFVPITDFLPYDKYMGLLNDVDIAMFNHDRQQAFGNIVSLLYLGKTVFISESNIIKEYMEKMGAKIIAIEDFGERWIAKPELSLVDRNINKEVIDKLNSDDTFLNKWNAVFY